MTPVSSRYETNTNTVPPLVTSVQKRTDFDYFMRSIMVPPSPVTPEIFGALEEEDEVKRGGGWEQIAWLLICF